MVFDPALALAFLMSAALTAYALLGGADYGAGIWDLLATGRSAAEQRRTISRAIAPVWEANHVWLIFVVTILFAAFPTAFARISIALHIPIALALVGITLRGSAFVFRAYGPANERATRLWGRVFAAASAITPLLLGMVAAAVTEGRLDPMPRDFRAMYLDPWLTPFAISVGVFAVVLFAFLAATYLTLEAETDDVREAFRTRALVSGVSAVVTAVVVLALAGEATHVRAVLTTSRWAVALDVTAVSVAIAALTLLWVRQYWWARNAAAAGVCLILWGWALAQYPYLVRPDVTIFSAAAPRSVLVLLVGTSLAGIAVLVPSLWYLFWIFGPRDRRADPTESPAGERK